MLQEKKSKRGTLVVLLCTVVLLALVIVLENTMKPTHMLFTVLKKGAVYAVVASSMNLLNGFTGLFSLGQSGFMLLGAYTYAILTIPVADRESVYYIYQGSAIKFSLPELFGGGPVGLVLGDNIFHGSGFSTLLKNAVHTAEAESKATVFGYWVSDPERYGVAEFDKDGNCLSIEEKPSKPKSNYAVVGLYFYPNKVVEVAKHIKPSARGELEITTVNQEFLAAGELKVQTLGRGFAWLDTGTHDSLAEATAYIETIEKRQGLKVACLEGIALRKGWISPEKVRELARPMLKNQYGQYLLKTAGDYENGNVWGADEF